MRIMADGVEDRAINIVKGFATSRVCKVDNGKDQLFTGHELDGLVLCKCRRNSEDKQHDSQCQYETVDAAHVPSLNYAQGRAPYQISLWRPHPMPGRPSYRIGALRAVRPLADVTDQRVPSVTYEHSRQGKREETKAGSRGVRK